jgi:hypothetical protein
MDMKAGRELDALVAEKVMGITVIHDWDCGYMPECGNYEADMPAYTDETFEDLCVPLRPAKSGGFFDEIGPVHEELNSIIPVPFYSTSIEAAWVVVGKLRERWGVELYGRGDGWACLVEEGDEVSGHYIAEGDADTVALAICLAAIKCVGVEVNHD